MECFKYNLLETLNVIKDYDDKNLLYRHEKRVSFKYTKYFFCKSIEFWDTNNLPKRYFDKNTNDEKVK